MAAPDRSPAQHLGFLAAAREKVRLWGLFPLVRGAEARAPELPRVGRSRLPAQNVVDLSQTPHMEFAQSTLEDVVIAAGRARVSGYWFGLVGPMGPLPIHMTEFAVYEKRYARTRPFGRFLDLITGRMLQFFYRAWADSQPAAMADRPDEDPFAGYIADLTGAYEGTGPRSHFPGQARLHYAALFASQRSARGIEDALSHLLRQPVQIHEFQPRWHPIEPGDRTRLGQAFATLGSDMVVGARVRIASDAFRLIIRAKTLRDYEALLPSGARFPLIAEALTAFAPSHLDWDVALEIEEKLVPAATLSGSTRLGWTSWLKPGKTDAIRRDTILKKPTIKNPHFAEAA